VSSSARGGAAAIAAVLLLCSCAKPAPEPYVRVSGAAPVVAPSAPRTRAQLLTFWATWCTYCREETTALRELATSPPPGLSIVVVSEDKSMREVETFFGGVVPRELNLQLDDDWRVAHTLRVHELPTSVLVVDGQAVARFDGKRRWAAPSARTTLTRLLEQAPQRAPNP